MEKITVEYATKFTVRATVEMEEGETQEEARQRIWQDTLDGAEEAVKLEENIFACSVEYLKVLD